MTHVAGGRNACLQQTVYRMGCYYPRVILINISPLPGPLPEGGGKTGWYAKESPQYSH